MKTKQVAYNYDKQEWVTDHDQATALRRQQLTEELTLLMGPNGIRYANFIELPRSIAIERCRNLLATLI
jgi:hypothetical protein